MKDLTGLKFGRLTVLGFAGVVSSKYTWLCRCDCGKEKPIRYQPLTSGVTRSCGCLHKEMLARKFTKHGHTRKGVKNHPMYQIWSGMKDRCYNRKNNCYSSYGGRGIAVCNRWLNSFQFFLDDMGERPSKNHSIDRIDNNGNYEPSNCRWATNKEQSRNKSTNIWIEHDGESMIIADWAIRLNMTPENLRSQLRYKPLSKVILNEEQ